MKGKTVIITGANSGIGKAAALALAKMGAHIVMICRNPERANLARQEIIQQSNNQQVDLFICDLSVQQQIRQLASKLLQTYPRIDVLLNNAGLMTSKRTITQDGLETTFATNHIAYFLLTNLLLPNINAAPNARIVNVASGIHPMIREVDFDNLQSEKSFQPFTAYALSKLGNILFTYELARRLAAAGSNTTVNCLHPGFVGSNFGQNDTGSLWMHWSMKLLKPFIRTPEKGAETAVYLASADKVTGISGQYFVDCKAASSSSLSYDTALAGRFWQATEKLAPLTTEA
ncbi:KR domain-containing protein [Sphingobacteriales bacterium UPWRP_1]|nr:hypothetical protein B6N25_10585 [Sphingobacteriales bacterium TSM_CSS]PSJ79018.1 KR domain-containing protein [Sphingobacteriales bacterium UPWRP_1]